MQPKNLFSVLSRDLPLGALFAFARLPAYMGTVAIGDLSDLPCVAPFNGFEKGLYVHKDRLYVKSLLAQNDRSLLKEQSIFP